ncbi:hypothetical protein VTN77DRAFT_4861 [Rasamsonia byssochlamydoides]|uniref:uncharacterized protein n=1 Tax=Rasamsonia byssochlamydoides TaxID=89139 RepID=UPI003743F746
MIAPPDCCSCHCLSCVYRSTQVGRCSENTVGVVVSVQKHLMGFGGFQPARCGWRGGFAVCFNDISSVYFIQHVDLGQGRISSPQESLSPSQQALLPNTAARPQTVRKDGRLRSSTIPRLEIRDRATVEAEWLPRSRVIGLFGSGWSRRCGHCCCCCCCRRRRRFDFGPAGLAVVG